MNGINVIEVDPIEYTAEENQRLEYAFQHGGMSAMTQVAQDISKEREIQAKKDEEEKMKMYTYLAFGVGAVLIIYIVTKKN